MATQNEKIQAYAELGQKLGLFIGSITTPTKPDLPDKPGYKWELSYTWGSGSFAWTLEEDPDAPGTRENPIAWQSGMAVKANYWYTNEGHLYVCIKSGFPKEFTDEYFEQMD